MMMDKEELELNAKLQQKKNGLRKALKEKGILPKAGLNAYDNYKYFSEAQYKQLFTELFSEYKLEFKFNEIEYTQYPGIGNQANGRLVKVCFTLIDIETGYSEDTIITGEGIDKGDKAGYKAYTGALKYYLADTFMVSTGDDAEKEIPMVKLEEKKATPNQIKLLQVFYEGELMDKLLKANNINKIEDITAKKASELIIANKARREK